MSTGSPGNNCDWSICRRKGNSHYLLWLERKAYPIGSFVPSKFVFVKQFPLDTDFGPGC